MVAFLRVQAYRDVLQAALLRIGENSYVVGKLKAFSVSFAHWRWGTLASVTRKLLDVQYAVVIAWLAAAFHVRGKTTLSVVVEAIMSPACWMETRALDL